MRMWLNAKSPAQTTSIRVMHAIPDLDTSANLQIIRLNKRTDVGQGRDLPHNQNQ